jgi:hypothetical protein
MSVFLRTAARGSVGAATRGTGTLLVAEPPTSDAADPTAVANPALMESRRPLSRAVVTKAPMVPAMAAVATAPTLPGAAGPPVSVDKEFCSCINLDCNCAWERSKTLGGGGRAATGVAPRANKSSIWAI